MSKVIEYNVVASYNEEDFSKKIKELLDLDWVLYGNPFTTSRWSYNQAMILTEAEQVFDMGPR